VVRAISAAADPRLAAGALLNALEQTC
jgi:thiamine monophosphate synthase